MLCLAAAAVAPSIAHAQVGGAAVAAQTETLVVRVDLNTENKGDFFVQRTVDRDFLLKVEDLKVMGFRSPAGTIVTVDGEPHLSLRSMRGVTSSFDDKTLALQITAEPQLLSSVSLGTKAVRRQVAVTPSGTSAFLNYALTETRGSIASNGLGLAAEAGVRWGDYLLSSDGSTVGSAAGKRFVRLMSSVTRDDRENLRRLVVGDLLTPSRDFSNSVNLGGVSLTKLYGIDPYFVRFPTQSLTGSVALPSDLEVYLDGQRMRTERLRPGDFELRDILAYGGARNVQVVLRDAFGRVQQLDYPLYFTEQPLQQGLHEYSYNFGALRRQFGLQSNRYGPAAFTMFHRYGASNAMTFGWRAEATRDLLNAGPTATLVLGNWGVVNVGMSASTIAGTHGSAGLASYTFESSKWVFSAFVRHDSPGYAGLADPPVMTNRRYEGSLSASYRLPEYASVSVSHTALSTRAAGPAATPAQPFMMVSLANRRVDTMTYSRPFAALHAQVTASLSRIRDNTGARLEAFVGLNFLLGRDYSGSAGYTRTDRQTHSETMRLTKNQPVGEGWGYDLSADRTDVNAGSSQLRSNVQYNAPAAVLRAEYGQYLDQGQRTREQRLSVAGGIVAAGGQVAVSRPITQSYAIVKVGEVADVGVLVDGQPVGKTDARGMAVIPGLNAYYENTVSIDTGALPMDYSLNAEVKKVAPALRSGTFLDFGANRTQAFSGKLKAGAQGAGKAVEFAEIDLRVDGKVQKLPTGRGGEFYVENLKPGLYPASVNLGAAKCAFELSIPRSDDMFVDLGELYCAASR